VKEFVDHVTRNKVLTVCDKAALIVVIREEGSCYENSSSHVIHFF